MIRSHFVASLNDELLFGMDKGQDDDAYSVEGGVRESSGTSARLDGAAVHASHRVLSAGEAMDVAARCCEGATSKRGSRHHGA